MVFGVPARSQKLKLRTKEPRSRGAKSVNHMAVQQHRGIGRAQAQGESVCAWGVRVVNKPKYTLDKRKKQGARRSSVQICGCTNSFLTAVRLVRNSLIACYCQHKRPLVLTPTHFLIHLFTHSLIHSLTHSLFHYFTHSITYSLAYSLELELELMSSKLHKSQCCGLSERTPRELELELILI